LQTNFYNCFFSFFGLRENPFTVSPDPRYLFVTRQIQETLDELAYGIETRKGIILLTGEAGTGKTTVINCLLNRLHGQNMPAAFIFSSLLEPSHLFDFMLADFGVPLHSQAKSNPLMGLNEWLFERYSAGKIPVLIVDEAQGLPLHVLEEIRMLLNLEARHDKLLQIVLAGQPELEEKLQRPELRQLKQRITIRCKTGALSLQETHDYIQARLNVAGAHGTQIFAFQAMSAVHLFSGGIPRVMNLLCEHALINAYVDDVHEVSAHIVEEVANEFQFDKGPLVPSIDFRGAGNTVPTNAQSVIPAEPVPLPQIVAPRSVEVREIHNSREALRPVRVRIFGTRVLRRLVIGSASRVRRSTRGLSFGFLRSTTKLRRLVWKDAERARERMNVFLAQWLEQPLAHRHSPIAGVHNRPVMNLRATIALSPQLPRSWHRWRNWYLSIVRRASRFKLTAPLLRWLRQPYRPFQLHGQTRRQ
jgi:general secretion pathway protein A